MSLPDPVSVWTLLWEELSANGGLSPAEREDLLGAFFLDYVDDWAEELIHNHVLRWEPWLRQRVRWRTIDYVRRQVREREARRREGAVAPSADTTQETTTWVRKGGAVPSEACPEPGRVRDLRMVHFLVWEALERRHQQILEAFAGETSGEHPDRAATIADASERLGRALSPEAFSAALTRARQRYLQLFAEHDPAAEREWDNLRSTYIGKRVVKICRHVGKAMTPFWLTAVEQAVFAVALEASLGWREPATAVAAAAGRSAEVVDADTFDSVLKDVLVKLEGAGAGRFFQSRLAREYVASRWVAVQRPRAGEDTGGSEL